MPGPRFSVVITCWNQRDFIRAAVGSALSQNRRLLKEVIVVDDGSTDGSAAALETYRDSIHLCVLPDNIGTVEARNEGAALAGGDYLVFLDGDDLLKPWALDVYERLIVERDPTVILGAATWFSGQVPNLTNEEVPRQIGFFDYAALIEKDRPAGLQASTYVVRRMSFWEAGGWTPGIFQLDLQDLSAKLALVPTVLIERPATAFYRIHGANTIHSVPPFVRNLHRITQKERAGEYPGGRRHRAARRAWLGGLITFWVKRSIQAGLYRGALGLVISGGPMILSAIARRMWVRMRGRQPMKTLDLRLAQRIKEDPAADRARARH